MRRSTLLVILMLCALCAFAPSALGAVAAIERAGGATVFDSIDKSAVAFCPAGKRVLGTGADIGSGSGQVSLEAVYPFLGPSTEAGVYAHEDENGFAGTWSLGYAAICATPVPGLQTVTGSTAFNSSNKGVTATCPVGKRLLGTGFQLVNTEGQVSPEAVVPNPALTAVSVYAAEDQNGYADVWAMTAFAVCANPISGIELRSSRSATNSTNGKPATASCPTGKQVSGIGGDIRGGGGQVVMDDYLPYNDVVATDAPIKVQVVGQEDEDGTAANWSAGAYAICVPASERIVASTASDTTSPKSVGADCPAGQKISGGGWDMTGALGQASVDSLIPVIGFAGLSVTASRDQSATINTWRLRTHAVCGPPLAGFQEVSSTSPSNSSDKAEFVSCPAGKKLVGVIGHVTGNAPELAITRIGPQPTSELTQAQVFAAETEFGTAANWSVTVRALCAIPPPGLVQVSDTSEPGSDPVSAIATCPAGKNVLSAGGAVSGGATVVLDDVNPNAALTRVVATGIEQLGIANEWDVTAYAICANP